MPRPVQVGVLLLSAAALAAVPQSPEKPPVAPVRAVTTSYFGVEVTDPYRYMENLKDPQVQSWMNAQNQYASALLESIPGRGQLLDRLRELDLSEPARLQMVSLIFPDRFFYLEQRAGQNDFKLYRRDGLSGKEVLLVDPATFSSSGQPPYSIDYYLPSQDGRYVAYGLSQGGSENSAIHVLDADTGQALPDVIFGARFGVTGWMPDGKSFLYNRLQNPAAGAPASSALEGSQVLLHRLGADPGKDVAVFGRGVVPGIDVDPDDVPMVATSPGAAYGVAVLQHGTEHSMLLYETPLTQLGKPRARWLRIGDPRTTILDFDLHGNQAYLLIAARTGPAVVGLDLSSPAAENWHPLLRLTTEDSVTGIQASANSLYITTLRDGRMSLVQVPYKPAAEIDRVNLPFDGSVHLLAQDPRIAGALMEMSSWTRAPAIYRYDPAADQVSLTSLWPAGPYDQPADVQAIQATALGSDGALIPMTLLYKNGFTRDATHPALLIGYGSYSMVISPVFSPLWRAWLDRGGLLAFAHVRGGGDFGGFWRFEGTQSGLVNRYWDFLACAQYLISQGYSSPAHLAAMSGSAGGILVGRAITERPDLFRAAIIESGLLDLLRFEGTAAGPMNVPEFGSVKTLAGFQDLEAISSYEHVASGVRYPAVLLEAGMNDARVGPWQSAKMAARLQAASTSGLPILLHIDAGAGHALGSTAEQARTRFADEMSFLLWQLGDPDFQPSAAASQTPAPGRL
ncbi:MAG TPA: prolyl oligopeptidase family serine peptidase [Candidatus Acidoferrales bacterium]|nr:prolyl oligopeptidase family serine peptidase [Candidatus Acidoferrales bacterium]